MAKQAMQPRRSALRLPENADSSNWHSSLIPYDTSDRAITRDDRRIAQEHRKQAIVIDAQAQKTVFGQTKIGEIHRHAARSFYHTTSHILATKREARGSDAQPYVDEFAERQVEQYARHLYGTVEVGGKNIGMEINRTLYVTAPEPGFWERLFRKG